MLRKCLATLIVALSIAIIGISSADARGRRGPKRGHVKEVLSQLNLTDEQRIATAEKVFELREANATKDEIRDAILEMFDEFGVEIPEGLSGRRGRIFHPLFILGDLLTDEQRTKIHKTVHEIVSDSKEDGVDREEIRDAVRVAVVDLLVGWGVIDGNGDDGDAAADLAVIDAEIQAAPSVSPSTKHRATSWGAIKTER